MGYILTQDASRTKPHAHPPAPSPTPPSPLANAVGPPRSGKGAIARAVPGLIGSRNVAVTS